MNENLNLEKTTQDSAPFAPLNGIGRRPTPSSLKLSQIMELPSLYQGQTDDLKMEYRTVKGKLRRIWLSRMTTQDGNPYNNMITIEELTRNGRKGWHWVTIKTYEAKP